MTQVNITRIGGAPLSLEVGGCRLLTIRRSTIPAHIVYPRDLCQDPDKFKNCRYLLAPRRA